MRINEFVRLKRNVQKMQEWLQLAGYLDPDMFAEQKRYKPPVMKWAAPDGIYGPQTKAAFYAWTDRYCPPIRETIHGIYPEDILEKMAAAQALPDLSLGDPAARIVAHMQQQQMYISMRHDTLNIVYLEGVNKDFRVIENVIDEWNDLRILIRILPNGVPVIVRHYEATVDPGLYYTNNPINRAGAARVVHGQYKAWKMGVHRGTQPALQQDGPVLVHRDKNKDGKRIGDEIAIQTVTINQHSTSAEYKGDKIGKYSAGCLVGRHMNEHIDFLEILKTDARYVTNNNYKFVTAILDGKQIFS